MAPLPVPIGGRALVPATGTALVPRIAGAIVPHLPAYGRTVAETVGVELVLEGLVRFVPRLIARAIAADRNAVDEMVDRMRADVPYASGNLYNGIEGGQENGSSYVRASAVHPRKGGADYAWFVEQGTAPGRRGGRRSYQAEAGGDVLYAEFDSQGRYGAAHGRRYGRTRRIYRNHPGTKAQPFFWHNVRDVLAERSRAMDNILKSTALELGFRFAAGSALDAAVDVIGHGGAPRRALLTSAGWRGLDAGGTLLLGKS